MKLREQIAASRNKVEAYNGFLKWLFFEVIELSLKVIQ
ncbi:hypothetical protein bcere0012_47710 [Bacillus cereus BDRD-ST24]|nr:hypothetical protein bcere0012_47710 [Bacillus cereus BDRD-ST24]